MRLLPTFSLIIGLVIMSLSTGAQGVFRNLDFESAVISGYPPNSPELPASSGLPYWSASYYTPGAGTNAADLIWYDGISLGGAMISIIDANAAQYGFSPLQGLFSAFVFGGLSSGGLPTYSTISQTGTVPVGAMSVLLKVHAMNGFIVALDGQTLNMIPLQTFPTYTQYAADVSAFAGRSAVLSITAPPTATPNGVLLDSIAFSSDIIPEPDALALVALGGAWLALSRRRGLRP